MRDTIDTEKIPSDRLQKGIKAEARWTTNDPWLALQKAEDKITAPKGPMAKVAMGLYPTIRQLVRMGVKPGPKERVRITKTHWKGAAANEEQRLSPHHFRNLFLAMGPAGGALGGGLKPLTETIEGRIRDVPPGEFPVSGKAFRNLPWRQAGRGALRGILPGAISGLVVGAILDAYLKRQLGGPEVTPKTAGALGKYAFDGEPQPQQAQSQFDPAQAQMLEQYYQAPLDQQDELQRLYMQAMMAPEPEPMPEPEVAPPPPSPPSQQPEQQETADVLEQQLQQEQQTGVQPLDSGDRQHFVSVARMFEGQGMDPVTALAQARSLVTQFRQHFRDPQLVAEAVRRLTTQAPEQQQAAPQQQRAQLSQQQDYYRQQAAPAPASEPQE